MIISWTTDPEPVPAEEASAIEVARFLYEEVEYGGLLWNETGPFPPLSPRQGRRYCEFHHHDWNAVSPELRMFRARDLLAVDSVITVTDDGVTVITSLFDRLRELGWLSPCPIVRTGFHPWRTGYRGFTLGKDCNSWWCGGCGPVRVLELVDQVISNVELESHVYTASCTYDRRLFARLRQRTRTNRANIFWYRTFDDRVYVVSTQPLPGDGNHAPAIWDERNPTEVRNWLLAEVMKCPTHRDHGWSDGWRPPATSDAQDGDDEQEESEWVWAHYLDQEKGVVVHERLMVQVRDIFGIDIPRGDEIPEALVPQINQLLSKIISDVRRGD